MRDINPTFNNQVSLNDNTPYFATMQLKKNIVAQLQGKTIPEQEAIIEGLLKLLDINLLAALALAYSVAPDPEKKDK